MTVMLFRNIQAFRSILFGAKGKLTLYSMCLSFCVPMDVFAQKSSTLFDATKYRHTLLSPLYLSMIIIISDC